MEWKFWRRNHAGAEVQASKAKLAGPKDLPQQIGQYLVVREKTDPDWVWALKCVLRPRQERKSRFDFRVFSTDMAQTSGVRVLNYDALDGHPELVLFQGWYDKQSNEIHMEKDTPQLAA